jgi:hypothetical protein
MCTHETAKLLCALTGLAVAAAQARAQSEARMMEGPAEQRIAVVADGSSLNVSRFVRRMVERKTRNLPPGVKVEVTKGSIPTWTEVVPVFETQTSRIDATRVVARRVDGRLVPYKVMMAELARPTPVLFMEQDMRLDSRFTKMFKPETLVLSIRSPAPITVFPSSLSPRPAGRDSATPRTIIP